MISGEVHGRVQTITLDRPAAMNALRRQDFAALDAQLRAAARDPEITVIVIAGAGLNFCAGQDLKELATLDPAELPFHPFHAFIENLAFLPKPVFAAVEGTAVGAGVTILPYADVVIAGAGARFRTPFVSLGATAEAGSSVALVAAMGLRAATRMLLLGDWVLAEEAYRLGLVTELVDDGDALTTAVALAQRLAENSHASVVATKELLVEGRRDAVSAAFVRERQLLHEMYGDEASQAAVKRFSARHKTSAAV